MRHNNFVFLTKCVVGELFPTTGLTKLIKLNVFSFISELKNGD